MIAQTSTN
jgi:hypothetical protein